MAEFTQYASQSDASFSEAAMRESSDRLSLALAAAL